MKKNTFFENIDREIIKEISKAENRIRVCVAWLTDENILRALIQQAKKEIFIEIITLNDEFNVTKFNFFN